MCNLDVRCISQELTSHPLRNAGLDGEVGRPLCGALRVGLAPEHIPPSYTAGCVASDRRMSQHAGKP